MVHAEGMATSHSQDRAHEVALDTDGEHAGRHRPRKARDEAEGREQQ